MYEQRYAALSAPFRTHPKRIRLLTHADKVLTTSFYILYPLLIILLFAEGAQKGSPLPFNSQLIPYLVVPACGFAVVSVMRKAINAPRPYEASNIDSLIKKDTQGESFPSKHVFSSFTIAVCWLQYFAPLGVVMLLLACLIAVVRVVGGVHYPKDVIAGAAIGILCGSIISIF